MHNVKNDNLEVLVYGRQPGEREIHRKSGLRISHFQRGISNLPLNQITPRQFQYYSICHLIEGKGWYWVPGQPIRYFSAGEGIIATPGFVQSYGGDQENFVEDFICFEGPVADYLFSSGVLENGIVQLGKGRRLLPIIEKALDLSDKGQIFANAALQELIYDLYREREEAASSSRMDRIDLLIKKLSSSTDKWWTVPQMADFCNLSENQFRRLFKKRTGMGPKHYSDSLKIQIASEWLLSSREGLDALASRLGYIDRFHFSKVFKRIKGISPDQFRKNYPLM